jgi:hypothetical protein
LGYPVSVATDGNQPGLTPSAIKGMESLSSLLMVAQSSWTDSQTTKSSQCGEQQEEMTLTLNSSDSFDTVFASPLQLE